jgi:hypothetical protein
MENVIKLKQQAKAAGNENFRSDKIWGMLATTQFRIFLFSLLPFYQNT